MKLDNLTIDSIIELELKEVIQMTTNANKEELHENYTIVTRLQELLDSIYSDVRHSYDVFTKDTHTGDSRYSLSLTYLSMSYQSYLEFERLAYEHGLVNMDIDPVLTKYKHYRHQLKKAITNKDSDASYNSAFNKFTDAKEYVSEFFSSHIREIVRQNSI